MPRKPVTDLSAWPALTLEGNLIAPAMVAAIADPRDDEATRQSYRIRKGLTLRDEISTAFRVGQSHFDAFRKQENPSADATRRFIRDFLAETLGFDDLAPHGETVSLLAGGRVPIVITPPSEEKLDRKSPTLSTDRSRSAAFALQDYLNEHDDALWGLATNGTVLRLLRDNASLTRPAYIEADLAQIFTNEDAASFSILWLLCHRTRFGQSGAPATDCALERWRDTGSKEGEAARDRLAHQVREALKLLGSGFLEANPALAARLHSGEINLTDWFNELLRLVYRLIFLMVAEDRNLLHPAKAPAAARKLYAEGYSLATLRALCTRASTWDRHHDRYEGVKIVFHALAHGQETLALPALGGLFTEDKLPHLETARLRNRPFMEALYRLAWLTDKSGMVPVNWRAMETEELGSVYESLLELQPQLGPDGKSLLFAEDVAEQRGNQRKTTGSYYTPDSLVQALLDTALDPVLDKFENSDPSSLNLHPSSLPSDALLSIRLIDPACGSGHFLLAAARRIATRVARLRAEGTPSTEDFRHALRDVSRRCLHGVDRNPMAVELTKVALWIETVDPGLPLGFFDAQIRCGDALLGVFDLAALENGIPDAAYKPLTGDDKTTAKYYLQANKDAKRGQGELSLGGTGWHMPDTKPLAIDFSGFRDLPEADLGDIAEKAARYRELRERPTFTRAFTASDLYTAAFLLPKTGDAPTFAAQRTVPTTEELWAALNHGKLRESLATAPQSARR
ncbi:MAG TPA: restriction endonuclease, partial [Bacteroidia bacterium]|nr:restriction endonuclease [Bacteroidia bacterium]